MPSIDDRRSTDAASRSRLLLAASFVLAVAFTSPAAIQHLSGGEGHATVPESGSAVVLDDVLQVTPAIAPVLVALLPAVFGLAVALGATTIVPGAPFASTSRARAPPSR